MKKAEQKLTLDGPTTYQIKVPGELDARWSDWAGEMVIAVQSEGDGPPVTTLTGSLDQAALQGLLRKPGECDGLQKVAVYAKRRRVQDAAIIQQGG